MQARFLCLSCLAIVVGVSAQAEGSLSVEVRASSTRVRVGEPFEVTVEISMDQSGEVDIDIPEVDGLNELSRRRGESTALSFGSFGSQVKRTVTLSLEYQPGLVGTVTLGPVRVRQGSVEAVSKALKIMVTESAATPAPGQAIGPGEIAPPTGEEAALFVRYRSDRVKAYLGEPIVIDLEVYANPTFNFTIEEVSPPPAPDGFWREVLDQPQTLTRSVTRIDGTVYHLYRVYRLGLYGIETGRKTIPQSQLTFSISRGLFDLAQRFRRTAPAIDVEVLPLPETGRPAGVVDVNVGEYTLEADVEPKNVAVGQAVTVTLRLEGRGNLHQAKLPTVEGIDGLRIYDPATKTQIETDLEGVFGSVQTDVLMMPNRSGKFLIPSFELAVFNPKTERYATLRTQPLTIEATPAFANSTAPSTGSAAPGPSSTAAEPTDRREPDIALAPSAKESGLRSRLRPIRYRTNLRSIDLPWTDGWYWTLLLAPFAVLGLTGVSRSTKRMLLGKNRRQRRARRRETQKLLTDARTALRTGDLPGAYRLFREVSLATLSTKLEKPVLGLTQDELRNLLTEKGIPESLGERLANELEIADFVRYASAPSTTPPNADLWCTLIDELDAWQPRGAS
jgi:hypothetical protein